VEEQSLADTGLRHDIVCAGMFVAVCGKYFQGSIDHAVLFFFLQVKKFLVHLFPIRSFALFPRKLTSPVEFNIA
jgi:endoglucanase Acf2